MNTNWKKWAAAALIRAVRTFAEAMIAYIGTGAVVLGDINWIAALSAASQFTSPSTTAPVPM